MKKPFMLALAALFASANATYTVRSLPAATGVTGTPYAYCINNNGIAVGYWSTSTYAVPAKWAIGRGISASTVSALSGYQGAIAYGINDSNEIVGCASDPSTSTYMSLRAFFTSSSGTTSAIPTLNPDADGYEAIPTAAYSIDNSHNVTGELSRYTTSTHLWVAPYFGFISSGAGSPGERPPKPLSTGFYPYGAIGYHIITTGSGDTYIAGLAGYWEPLSGDQYATACNTISTLGYLDPLGDIYAWDRPSTAFGSNTSGTIVGWLEDNSSNHVPFARTSAGSVSVLVSAVGEGRSINTSGDIVGWYTVSGSPHAFIKTASGSLTDLNTLIPSGSGWVLEKAYCINDNGWIVGTGTYSGSPAAFVLTP